VNFVSAIKTIPLEHLAPITTVNIGGFGRQTYVSVSISVSGKSNIVVTKRART
jgi:hypothetical protein